MTIQEAFANRTTEIVRNDENIIGLAVGGSWITNEIDAYSDLDLVLVTKHKIGGDKAAMLEYAERFGQLLSGFTGEHIGDTRVLICLYSNPLLHVDIKFVTLEEFRQRVELPVLLLDKGEQLHQVLEETSSKYPYPDQQWIEDRFWVWIHYALLKIGRGEYMEAFDFLGFMRMVVLGPLLHIRNGNLPRGVRKVETLLPAADLAQLKATVSVYSRDSILAGLKQCVTLYRQLRQELFAPSVVLQVDTELEVMQYFHHIEQGDLKQVLSGDGVA